MSALALLSAEAVLSAFLVFCRIGGCFLVAAGFASMRVPVQVRLFLALAVSLALTPLLHGEVAGAIDLARPADYLRAIGFELMIGFVFGLSARLFILALQAVAVAAATSMGLGALPATPVMDLVPVPAAATLFTFTATALVFILDLHLELIRGLLASYEFLPVGRAVDPEATLAGIVDRLAEAFLAALRVMSPFFVFAVVVNFAIGLTNKLTPQIPAFFIALPFMIAGALLLLALTVRELFESFMDAVGAGLLPG